MSVIFIHLKKNISLNNKSRNTKNSREKPSTACGKGPLLAYFVLFRR